jgi:ketosteroid isomerase-like protein
MNKQENLQLVERFWQAFDRLDFEAASELLHEDYVCVWPQSGECIQGRSNFVAVNKHYPQAWQVTIMRLLVSDDQVASEVKLTYRDEMVFAISFFEFRAGKIARETDYWPEPYDPPTWRAPLVE